MKCQVDMCQKRQNCPYLNFEIGENLTKEVPINGFCQIIFRVRFVYLTRICSVEVETNLGDMDELVEK